MTIYNLYNQLIMNVRNQNGQMSRKSYYPSKVAHFESIPYANIESSGRRFRPAKELSSIDLNPKTPPTQRNTHPSSPAWDASLQTPACIQAPKLSEADIEQSEDCLYLSVFMPHTTDINPRKDQSRDELYDVIVYFHGGAYGRGSKENIDGARLSLDQNFIVVSVSFRLGPFGFWVYVDKAIGNEGYDEVGNWALQDQKLALKFIYENIGSFGGNRNKITLMGCGSGGQAIAHHLLHSESNKYFHNAVLLSSTLGLPIDSNNNYFQYGAITSSLECCPNGLVGDILGWVN